MKNQNLILMTDSYKASHAFVYNPNIINLTSYLESRGGRYDYTVFFGLQYYLIKYLQGSVITKEMIEEADTYFALHFGRTDVFNRKGWEYILEKYNGKLPIRIKAVKEGSIIPTHNILMNIESTDPNCFWLVNYFETLLMKVWSPITVATQSREIKRSILKTLEKTGDPNGINFKCHDFGYRGVTSEETATLVAASHLISFMGTDTLAGITMLRDFYNEPMAGFSIPATEHSIICSFGKNFEVHACETFLNTYPTGLIACVSDTYNIYNACENIWGGVLRDKVLSRDGCLVVRPDSGDYLEVVPKVLEILWDKFGGTVNAKGYRVLDSHVRVIQGDGMEPNTIKALFEHINDLGWSSDNLAVGSGGGLLVKNIDRDTQKFAIKASAVQMRSGEWVGIQKTPITDSGKRSKMGRLKLIIENGQYKTVGENEPGEDQLVTVFENGEVLKTYTLVEVRENAKL